jgi:hypothetical protein
MKAGMRIVRVVLIAGLCSMGRRGEACRCSDEKASFESYRAVFIGTVTAIRDVELPSDGQLRRHKLVEFRAVAVWKGPRTAEQRVYTAMGGCGVIFKVGENYLVTATESSVLDADPSAKTKPMLFTNSCGRTAPAGHATGESFSELNRSYQRGAPPGRQEPTRP